jgi:hypothetical protein
MTSAYRRRWRALRAWFDDFPPDDQERLLGQMERLLALAQDRDMGAFLEWVDGLPHPTPEHVPDIDWPNLTDEALEALRTLVEAERQRRWLARRLLSPVDELHDSPRMPHPTHVEVFDTYHCRRHGTRYLSRGELRQEERAETFVYVCTLCDQVADPTPLF